MNAAPRSTTALMGMDDAGSHAGQVSAAVETGHRVERPAMDRGVFREAMSQLPAAVSIVTSNGRAGPWGLTVSSVASVTDEPATLSFCVRRASRARPIFRANGAVAINLLTDEQAPIGRTFAATDGRDRAALFEHEAWRLTDRTPPILVGCAMVVTGTIADAVEVGTHTLFLCAVESAAWHDVRSPSLYFRRDFTRLQIAPVQQ